MQLSFTQKKNIRKNFGKLVEGLSIPNLIEVQKNSYNEFLQSKTLSEQLSDLAKGIDKVFKSIFPIEDGSDKCTLEYISYKLEKPNANNMVVIGNFFFLSILKYKISFGSNSKSSQEPLPGIILQLNKSFPLAWVLPLS